ncbi:MAG: universal stress protein [Verrucomicrobia bacterium]|nr:universal stress protein [Verrucomicrobiota bacterium]
MKLKSAPSVRLQASKHRAVDLIVLGTKGHHGLKRLLLGSTVEAVVRQSPLALP